MLLDFRPAGSPGGADGVPRPRDAGPVAPHAAGGAGGNN